MSDKEVRDEDGDNSIDQQDETKVRPSEKTSQSKGLVSPAHNLFVRNETEASCLCWDYPKSDKKKRDDENECGDDEDEPSLQYRLEATDNTDNCFWRRLPSYFCGWGVGSGGTGVGINHNRRLASILHWMFRVNFVFLFAVMCTIFLVWVMIFAGFILLAGRIDQQCVRVGGDPFSDAASQFADAFALSWTTFSTVGYGSTYPALGHENENPTNCFFITFVCCLESFLGVLYSGFCGAILFGKVLRIQSHAQVVFSDPIVIRYGSGVHHHIYNESIHEEEDLEGEKIPCPVLEFRVVNRLFAEPGGEIIDATLNCVANVDADDTNPSLRNDVGSNEFQYAMSSGADGQSYVASTVDSVDGMQRNSGNVSHDSDTTRAVSLFLETLTQRNHQTVDEDPSARLVKKRTFSKMVIEAEEHPFFKRVWLGRHVLDETSPIVEPKVRRQIRQNNGYWPERLNDYRAVRDSLQFSQILVSVNGISNVSAAKVYAQKIYDSMDINVGYQFVNLLYKDTDGSLKVDTDLINDVRQQCGPNAAEPLILGTD
ncbi:inward rectifier potassium channel [Nitzschia inconspicua]|uniref:Inward rectifier potassium channel n=1 Tax=Nitzschia inconspicua TaxID=303405 RepID=A0A9K3PN91_9STRA|nr:inward rectifier potassium channel [Nitzschia inconspicua]